MLINIDQPIFDGLARMGIFKPLVDALNRNPLVRGAKRLRDGMIQDHFRSQGLAQGAAFASSLKQTGSRQFCFVVAFNTPWVVDAMTKAWLMYAPHMTLVIVDNSSKLASRKSIEHICASRGIHYFALPGNLERHPSRSHGTALNWTFHNLVRHLEPDLFGFLDHDCFPVAPLDIASRIADKLGYGQRRNAISNVFFSAGAQEPGWYLWPGLCFFKFEAVRDLDLDFTPRLEWGMDTGGGNWPILYSRLTMDDIMDSDKVLVVADGMEGTHQLLDGNLFHVRGAADWKGFVNVGDYRNRLSTHVWNAYLGGVEGRIVNDF